MEILIRQKAFEYLSMLIGHSLLYAKKSSDTELYDFGFGEPAETVNRRGKRKLVGAMSLHALCRIKIIWRNGERKVDKYYEDTPCEEFHHEVKRCIGLQVSRIALSDKNDLWFDLGDYWIVFATFENGEESWRFFTSDINDPHLVASNSWLYFSD